MEWVSFIKSADEDGYPNEVVRRILGREIDYDQLPLHIQNIIDSDKALGKKTVSFRASAWNQVVAPILSKIVENSMDGDASKVYGESEINDIASSASKYIPNNEFLSKVKTPDGPSANDLLDGIIMSNASDIGGSGGVSASSTQGRSSHDTSANDLLDGMIMANASRNSAPVAAEGPSRSDSPKSRGASTSDAISKFKTMMAGRPEGARAAEPVGWYKRLVARLKKLKVDPASAAIGALAAGTLGLGALGIYGLIRMIRKRRSNTGKEMHVKKASWMDMVPGAASATKAFVGKVLPAVSGGNWGYPELSLIEDALTASTKEDYKDVNANIRDMTDRWSSDRYIIKGPKGEDGNDTYIDPSDLWPIFDTQIYRPGDKVSVTNDMARPMRSGINAAYSKTIKDGARRPFGISRDYRSFPVTLMAATMLNSQLKGGSTEPSISNMAYAIPFVNGQYAIDSGLTEDDMSRARRHMDDMTMEALVQQMSKYPASKNVISAFVNGGFGDVSDPDGFGLKPPLWDYKAQHLTPEGTNMLRQATHDIASAGGYSPIRRAIARPRGYDDYRDEPVKSYPEGMKEKHLRELLRFVDTVGPRVLTQKTVLGKDMLFHPELGLIPNLVKAYGEGVPYFTKDPGLAHNINMGIGGGIVGSTLDELEKEHNGNGEH